MFDIGFWELALIGVLALIVLGPKRLPEAARFAGRWVARIRNMIASVKEDFDEHLKSEELAELRKLKEELQAARENLTQTSAEIGNDLASINPDSHDIGGSIANDEQHEEHDFLLDAIEESAPEKKANRTATQDQVKPAGKKKAGTKKKKSGKTKKKPAEADD